MTGEAGVRQSRYETIHVVTVNRDNARGLDRTIESLNQQTYTNWRHYIQDANSSDDSLLVCRSHEDPRRSVVSEPDGGIYDGMNRGVQRAGEGLVWFLNSGDTLAHPEVLRRVNAAFAQQKDQWAVGGIIMESSTAGRTWEYFDSSVTDRRVLRGLGMFPHPSTVYRSQFLRGLGGFRVDAGVAADQELAIRAYRLSVPSFIPEPLTRFEPGGASAGGPLRHEKRLARLRRSVGEPVGGSWTSDSLWVCYRTGVRVIRNMMTSRL